MTGRFVAWVVIHDNCEAGLLKVVCHFAHQPQMPATAGGAHRGQHNSSHAQTHRRILRPA